MSLADDIEGALGAHRKSLTDIWRLIRKVQRDANMDATEKDSALECLYSQLSYKDIKQHFVMDGIKYDIGVSFRSSMANMMRTKSRLRSLGYNIAPGGNNKMHDVAFARKLGVPAPRTLEDGISTDLLRLQPGTIIKPVEGANSRGVFLVRDDLSLYSIKSRQCYVSVDDALTELGPLKRLPRWIVEQAVLGEDGELARDMKIYMFYGFPGIFIEIERGTGEGGRSRYATYDHDQKEIQINRNYEQMKGTGIPDDVIAYAREISIGSPVPFLRVDFLVGADGSYLGEVTPHPGDTYAGDLLDGIDRRMGEFFLEAEARLYVDLSEGKRFQCYHDTYESVTNR